MIEAIKEIEQIPEQPEEKPQDLKQWRKYLWSRFFKLKKIQELEEVKKSIVESYDTEIKKQQDKLDQFEGMLKYWLINDHQFLNKKTGGYSVKLPDLGNFTASKPGLKIIPSEKLKALDIFLEKQPDKYSAKKFKELTSVIELAAIDKLEDTVIEIVKEGEDYFNPVTGEGVDLSDYDIKENLLVLKEGDKLLSKKYETEISRSYSFPKIERVNKNV